MSSGSHLNGCPVIWSMLISGVESRDLWGRRRGLQNPQKDRGENAVVAGISKQLSSHYKTPLMMSLKEVRNQLLISHDDGVINDEELLLLYDLNRSDNLDLPYNSYPGFDFDDLEDDECLSEFRFYKNDLPFLAEVLGIPEVVDAIKEVSVADWRLFAFF